MAGLNPNSRYWTRVWVYQAPVWNIVWEGWQPLDQTPQGIVDDATTLAATYRSWTFVYIYDDDVPAGESPSSAYGPISEAGLTIHATAGEDPLQAVQRAYERHYEAAGRMTLGPRGRSR